MGAGEFPLTGLCLLSEQHEGCDTRRKSEASLCTKKVKGRAFFSSTTKPAFAKPTPCGRPWEVHEAPGRKPQRDSPPAAGWGLSQVTPQGKQQT
jgi:hypothetical protein